MTQVNIKRLDSLTHNDTAATKLLNDNFQAVKKALEDSLSRSYTEPNYMDTNLDMNSKRIINVADPVEASDIVNKGYVDDVIGNAADYAKAAEISASQARSYAEIAKVNADTISLNLLNNYYTKTEVDAKVKADIDATKAEFNTKIGNIDKVLDEINGEVI